MSSAMEIFDIFNASNEFLGREYRKNVHKFGLYHRAVRMFVFNSKGEILTQRRVPNKDIAPNAWDLSAAEHLKPSESYVDGAVRGLKEELNIDVKPEQMTKLRSPLLYTYVNKEKGIKDFEYNETYKVIYDGEFTVDPVEVAEAKFVSWDEFVRRFEEHPEQCTPWLIQEMNLFKSDQYKSLLEHKH